MAYLKSQRSIPSSLVPHRAHFGCLGIRAFQNSTCDVYGQLRAALAAGMSPRLPPVNATPPSRMTEATGGQLSESLQRPTFHAESLASPMLRGCVALPESRIVLRTCSLVLVV